MDRCKNTHVERAVRVFRLVPQRCCWRVTAFFRSRGKRQKKVLVLTNVYIRAAKSSFTKGLVFVMWWRSPSGVEYRCSRPDLSPDFLFQDVKVIYLQCPSRVPDEFSIPISFYRHNAVPPVQQYASDVYYAFPTFSTSILTISSFPMPVFCYGRSSFYSFSYSIATS